jgi:hypothetical protein
MTATNQIKSQLARLLATENITVMHSPGAKTASFDVKNRNLILPVWQNISDDLYDMLVVHETGHALDTPGDAWIEHINAIAKKYHPENPDKARGAIKNFMNVIEDARIDKRQKRRYPGSRRNYVAGYKELFERNFFGTLGKDVNSFNFIDRLNMYFKGGVLLGIKFSAPEMVFVNRIDNAETFEDVIALTEDVYKFCLDANKIKSQTASDDIELDEVDEDDMDFDYEDVDGDGEDSNDSDDGIGSVSTDGDDESDDVADGDEGDGDADSESGDDETESKVKSKPSKNSEVGGSFDSTENDIPDSETEKAANKNLDTIVRNDDVNYVYLTIPKYDIKNIVDDFSVVIPQMEKEYARYKSNWTSVQSAQKNFVTFKQKENDSISFMVKEFEMKKRADAYSRTRIAKTGVIDTNKMFSYKYNDDIFRRTSVVPEGKNYGFCMFLDWSGSMVYNIEYTMKQLMSLVMFCKRVQIPFDVYLFREADSQERFSKQFDYKTNDITFHNFKLRNILSSRMNTSTLNKAFEILFAHATNRLYYPCDKMESTPLNQAIVVAETIVNDFRKKNKLQGVNTIFLTDGGSDSITGYHDQSRTYLPHKPKGNMYILNDTVMKKSYNINSMHGQVMTDTLLKILKDRTQSNVIGFYLHSGSLRNAGYLLDPYNAENKKQWSDNGYIAISSKGYDDYYIINTQTKSADKFESVAPGISKQRLASAFIKFAEKKTVNRVLLSKFMDKVCRVA